METGDISLQSLAVSDDKNESNKIPREIHEIRQIMQFQIPFLWYSLSQSKACSHILNHMQILLMMAMI